MQYLLISLIIGLCSCDKDIENNDAPMLEVGDIVIVVKDSIPLRNSPDSISGILKYAYISMQLEILEISSDTNWYKVKIGEDKGLQLSHIEEYWTHQNEVYLEPKKKLSEINIDVSVYENGNLNGAIRVEKSDYLNEFKSLDLDSKYYIGATYVNKSPQKTCSPPFSICAQTFEPGHYFSHGQLEYSDAETEEELINRYKQLYENGTIVPFYEIKSGLEIMTIDEKLVCSKIITDVPGCYDYTYIGTETDILIDETYTVNDNYFLSPFTLESDYLFDTKLNGGVQFLHLLYILDIKYSNDQYETIVRRISLWWPKCM